jgi:uncharacterized protein YjiS (DUF1127 family)
MREYFLNQAASRQMTFAGSLIARVINDWKNRRAARELEEHDDFMLRDIGITRGELRQAGLPAQNAGSALGDRS